MTTTVLWDACILMKLWVRDYKCEKKKLIISWLGSRTPSFWMKGDSGIHI